MRFLLATTVKDLRRRARDPASLLLWAAIPAIIATLLQLAFGGDGPTVRAELLLVDQDQTLASRALAGAFSQGQLGELIQVETVELDDGRQRIDRGDGSALLVIPDGFGAAVLDQRPVELELVKNPAERIRPQLIEEVVDTLLEALFYADALIGDEIRRIRSQTNADLETDGPSDVFVSDIAVSINGAMSSLADLVFPPILALETSEEAGEPEHFGALFLLGMLFMALMFVSQAMAEDIWQEKQLGTLARTLTSPRRPLEFMAGKVLAAGVLLAGFAAIGMLGARYVFGQPLANVGAGILWATLFGISMVLILTLVQLLASTQRAGNVLASMVVFPLALAGGSFFPLEVMPEFLATIGRATPNGWALGYLKAIVLGSAPPAPMAVGLAVQCAWVAAALGACAWLVSVRFVRR